MKAILYILVLAALLASSCATGGRYVKSEFDDLYYLPSDRVMVNKSIASHNLPGDLKQEEQYFDNIYSGDTLIAEQYNENVDFDNSLYYNKDYSPFEYMDDWSYSNRLRRFYGNYFYPYWRDPFYYSWNYTPWYYYDYFYNPYWEACMIHSIMECTPECITDSMEVISDLYTARIHSIIQDITGQHTASTTGMTSVQPPKADVRGTAR